MPPIRAARMLSASPNFTGERKALACTYVMLKKVAAFALRDAELRTLVGMLFVGITARNTPLLVCSALRA